MVSAWLRALTPLLPWFRSPALSAFTRPHPTPPRPAHLPARPPRPTGGEGLNGLIKLVALGGRIVSYGATAGRVPSLDIHRLFLKNAALVGSTMGSPREFRAMLRWVH